MQMTLSEPVEELFDTSDPSLQKVLIAQLRKLAINPLRQRLHLSLGLKVDTLTLDDAKI